jgi:hypothetical protein
MSRAGLPPVLLPHVGFESLYEQRQQGAQAPGASAPLPAAGASPTPDGK